MNLSLHLTPLILALIRPITGAVLRMKKSFQFNVRLPLELRDALLEACEAVGLDATTVTRACLKAFIDEVTRTGEIRLPLAIVPKAAAAPHAAAVMGNRTGHSPTASTAALRLEGDAGAMSLNEPPARYPAGKKAKPTKS